MNPSSACNDPRRIAGHILRRADALPVLDSNPKDLSLSWWTYSIRQTHEAKRGIWQSWMKLVRSTAPGTLSGCTGTDNQLLAQVENVLFVPGPKAVVNGAERSSQMRTPKKGDGPILDTPNVSVPQINVFD